MADDSYKEDKTEKGTGKKRADARNKGQVCQSQEIGKVSMLLFMALIIYALSGFIFGRLNLFYRMSFIKSATLRISSDNLVKLVTELLLYFMTIVGPIMFFILLIVFVTSYLQIGWLWTLKPLEMKWNKLIPDIKKLNFIKKDKFIELFLDIGKLCLILPVVYYTAKAQIFDLIPHVDKPLYFTWVFILKLVFKIVIRVSILLIFLAAIDYAKAWFKYEEDMKMTKEEVKQERKNMEGDPQIKSWQKRHRMAEFRRMMMSKIPEADVVITNPIHYAIAIKYDEINMNAPRVVGKGMRKVAEKIKEIAKKHGIPIVENKPLAQALYKDVEVGQEIPSSFYKAVAEVLAYVFKLKNKKVPV